MDSFYDKIREQLSKMTEQEKDVWILSQAKILPVWRQEFTEEQKFCSSSLPDYQMKPLLKSLIQPSCFPVGCLIPASAHPENTY